MAKGHYQGGSTLVGHGRIIRSKGRSGGIGDTSSAAIRDQRCKVENKRKQNLAEVVKKNQRKMRQLGKKWAEDNQRMLSEQQLVDQRAKSSPLAAALNVAFGLSEKSKN